MSYILDALRRAEAERENASVPGLGAHPRGAQGPQQDQGWVGGVPWRWVGLGLGLGLVLPVVWVIRSGSDEPQTPTDPVSPAHVAMPPPSLSTPPPAPPPAPAPGTVGPITPIVAAPPPPPSERLPLKSTVTPSALKPAPRPRGDEAAVAGPGVGGAGVPPSESGGQGVPPPGIHFVPAPQAAAESEAAAQGKIYALHELPDDIRRSLPALHVGGSVYADQAANRIVILNGQIFREHDEPTPGLKIEKIKLKGATLNFKGYRYEIDF